MHTKTVAGAMLAILTCSSARAGTVFNSEAAWQADVLRYQTASFDIGLPPNGSDYESSFSSNGLTISGALYFNANTYVVNGVTVGSTDVISVNFIAPVFAFAFNSYDYTGEPLTISLGNGETYTTAQSSQAFFYGVVSNQPFTTATVQELAPNYVWSLTDASYAAVPEPVSLTLLGAGMAGTAYARRRQRPTSK